MLRHILGMCMHTESKRITRHDEIKDFIAERAPERFSVFVEPVVNVSGDLKKLDLIIKDQNYGQVHSS